jgi:hypothetical protein
VWMRLPYNPRPSSVPVAPPSAFFTNAASPYASSSASASWYPDSGASFHVTNDARNLQQLTPFEGQELDFHWKRSRFAYVVCWF